MQRRTTPQLGREGKKLRNFFRQNIVQLHLHFWKLSIVRSYRTYPAVVVTLSEEGSPSQSSGDTKGFTKPRHSNSRGASKNLPGISPRSSTFLFEHCSSTTPCTTPIRDIQCLQRSQRREGDRRRSSLILLRWNCRRPRRKRRLGQNLPRRQRRR